MRWGFFAIYVYALRQEVVAREVLVSSAGGFFCRPRACALKFDTCVMFGRCAFRFIFHARAERSLYDYRACKHWAFAFYVRLENKKTQSISGNMARRLLLGGGSSSCTMTGQIFRGLL